VTIRLPVFERLAVAAALRWLALRNEQTHPTTANVCAFFAVVFFIVACITAVEKPKEHS